MALTVNVNVHSSCCGAADRTGTGDPWEFLLDDFPRGLHDGACVRHHLNYLVLPDALNLLHDYFGDVRSGGMVATVDEKIGVPKTSSRRCRLQSVRIAKYVRIFTYLIFSRKMTVLCIAGGFPYVFNI